VIYKPQVFVLQRYQIRGCWRPQRGGGGFMLWSRWCQLFNLASGPISLFSLKI